MMIHDDGDDHHYDDDGDDDDDDADDDDDDADVDMNRVLSKFSCQIAILLSFAISRP